MHISSRHTKVCLMLPSLLCNFIEVVRWVHGAAGRLACAFKKKRLIDMNLQ